MSDDDRQLAVLAFPTVNRARRRKRRLGGVRVLPSGRVQVRVRIRLPSGERYELQQVCEAAHVDLVRARLMNKAREYRDGLAAPDLTLSLDEYRVQFERARGWSRDRASTYKLLRALHKVPLREITDARVSAWSSSVLWRGDGKPPSGKASRGYLRHAFELLRVMLLQAVRDRVISGEPCSARPPGMPSHKNAFSKRRVATSDELVKLIEAARALDARARAGDARYAADLELRVWLLAQTGVRPLELRRARREWLQDAHRVAGAAFVPGAGILSLPACKGGNPHDVALPPELYRAVLSFWHTLPSAAQSIGLLFPVCVRGRWHARASFVSSTQWQSLCRLAQVDERLVCYQLRHTRLTEIANDPRQGPRGAQAQAGHADLRTTQGYLASPESVGRGVSFEASPGLAKAFENRGSEPLPPNTSGPTPASRALTRTGRPKKQVSTRRSSTRASACPESSSLGACVGGTLGVPPERAPVVPPELRSLNAQLALEPWDDMRARLLQSLGILDALRFAREVLELSETGPAADFARSVLDLNRPVVAASYPCVEQRPVVGQE